MSWLVTGGAGFIGANLVEALLAAGKDVVAVDTQPTGPGQAESFGALPGRLHPAVLDIRDANALEELMRRHGVERVIHAAAITSDAERDAVAAPDIMSVNVTGTAATVQAACLAGASRVVLAGSIAVFAPERCGDGEILTEDAARRPEGLYALSKATAEDVTLEIAALHGTQAVVGRIGIAFGPWERETGLRDTLSPILRICVAEAEGREVRLSRDRCCNWHYGRDAANALIRLAEGPAPSHTAYNLGAPHRWTLSAWCEKLKARNPGFRWSIASPANVEVYIEGDGGFLSGERFLNEFGQQGAYDLDAAFTDYITWRA